MKQRFTYCPHKIMLLAPVLVVVWAICAPAAMAQDLSGLGDGPPVKLSGSVNATTIAYESIGILPRRDPFTWFLTGNLNLDIYGWSVPLSFSFSEQERNFRQPFNQYGISPEYKWVKTYLGYHNLTYSRYTLAGHVFLGGAVEMTPGKWRINAMYGRLNKAVAEDTVFNPNATPTFQRMGAALKVGYGDNQEFVDVTLFRAADEINSIAYVPEQSDVLPMENMVVSVNGKKQITKRVAFSAEYASSALTRDTRIESVSLEQNRFFNGLGGLFTPRASSTFYSAMNGSLGYFGNFYTVQLNYERIDPGYRTLGAYFFNNDQENITVAGSLKLLKGKLNLNGNVGTQRNNLSDSEVSTVRRAISTLNASYVPNATWNFNAAYSNFATITNIRPQLDPFFQDNLDSLNFFQVTQNANMSVGYNWGNKQIKKGLFLNTNFQVVNDDQDNEFEGTGSSFVSGSLAYRFSFIPKATSISASVNVNNSSLQGNSTTSFGPNISVNRSFLQKKLRSTLTGTFNYVSTNGQVNSRVLSLRANGSYTLQKKHSFSMNVTWVQRFSSATIEQGYSELTATTSYSYNF